MKWAVTWMVLTLSVAGVSCSSDKGSADSDQKELDMASDRGGVLDTNARADLCLPEDELCPSTEVKNGSDTSVPDVPTIDVPVVEVVPDVAAVDQVTPDVQPTFPLEVGDKVPDFSLKAHDGSTFVLSQQAGKNVMISSFPAAKTAVCEWQTCWVNDHYDEFVAVNTVPVGLSTDNLGKLALWAKEQDYKQLLLSDTDPVGEVSKMFGIFAEAMGVTSRALLVIDGNGVLVYKKVFAMGAKPDFETLMDFLSGL